MKIRVDQLAQYLKKTLSPVYVIGGNEPFQILESCNQIRRKAFKEGFKDRIVYTVDHQFDCSKFLLESFSLSLFSSKKLIELRIQEKKISERMKKALQEYLENLCEHNVLMIVFDYLDSATQKAKWFKSLEQKSIFIFAWPIEQNRFPVWLEKRIQQLGYSIMPEALNLLVYNVQGNLLAASQVFTKLPFFLKSGGAIDKDLIKALTYDSAHFEVFELMDSVLKLDIEGSLHTLKSLKNDGCEETLLLWTILRDLRIMSHMARLKARNNLNQDSLQALAKLHGLAPFFFKKRQLIFEKMLTQLTEKKIRSLLTRACCIDQGIKGVISIDVWQEISSLLLSIVGIEVPSVFIQ